MKRKKTGILLFLAIISLLAIGGVMLYNFIKKPKEAIKNTIPSSILGETTSVEPTNSPFNYIDTLVKETVNNTKSTVSEKMAETQKSAVQTIEKEIGNLAQSQVEALKLQICRDWGVVTVSPTPTP